MERVKDKTGEEWLLEVDNSMLAPLREVGFDLSAFVVRDPKEESESIQQFTAAIVDLLTDPEMIGRALWILCEEQIAERKLDDRQFARRWNADSLCCATDAILFALFDHAYRRPALRRMIRERLPRVWADAEAKAIEG